MSTTRKNKRSRKKTDKTEKTAAASRNSETSNGREQHSFDNNPGENTRHVAGLLLTRIIDDKRSLDALVDSNHGLDPWIALKQGPGGDADQALCRAIVQTALRHRADILFVLDKVLERALPKGARHLHHTLHVAAAQILFMDLPDSAAVNIAVNLIGNDKRSKRFKALGNAILRRISREKIKLQETLSNNHVFFAPWLEKRLRRDYGRDKIKLFASTMKQEPSLDITPKSDAKIWASRLNGHILPTGSIRLSHKTPVHQLPGYQDGQWWVQDAAAAIPVKLLGDVSGKRVADLCAAPGGKTAQLAAMGATVTAVEKVASRIRRLTTNLERLKFDAEIIQADVLEWPPEQKFDAILLDAPCSSTGTIRRHPDVMWTKNAEEVTALAQLQKQLLMRAACFLAPGGTLVFANCSILKEEGEDLLADVLKNIARDLPGMAYSPIDTEEWPEIADFINGQGAIRTNPAEPVLNPDIPKENGMDAFFACRFKRIANAC